MEIHYIKNKRMNYSDFVKLSACGDIRIVNINSSYQNLKPIFSESDIIFGNLEGPIITGGNPYHNGCCINSNIIAKIILKEFNFNILSLANNHIFDYGLEGFNSTINALNKLNIGFFGAGLNLDEARKPLIITRRNLKFGFLGYNWKFIGGITAGKSFGTAPLKREIILEDIELLKDNVDFIIISVHWGYEKERYPLPYHRKLAHELIDNGANLIIGHHPHVIQGIEKYNNGLIVYSLGNFIFPDIIYGDKYKLIQKKENKESIIFNCYFGKDLSIGFDCFPIFTENDNYPKNLRYDDQILKQIRILSAPLLQKNYKDFWKKNRVRKDLPDFSDNKIINKMIYFLYKSNYGKPVLQLISKL